LLWHDGQDLRQLPLIERKDRLARLVQQAKCERLLFAQHVEQYGERFFEEICSQDLEGIVAKRKLGIYKDDGDGWIKIKNRRYSQAEGRHELLTGRRAQGAAFSKAYPAWPLTVAKLAIRTLPV